jgi:poly(ADP-ribose) glycohydrolase
MPCSIRNVDIDGNRNWDKIWKAFHKKVVSLDDFFTRIKEYNNSIQNIDGLHAYFNTLDKKNQSTLIEELIPGIVGMALLMSTVFGGPIPYLSKSSNMSISLTKYQTACLIANSFICSFPGRDKECLMDGHHVGNFNMTKLFEQTSPTAIVKIKCFLSYLEQSMVEFPVGIITFSRFSNETPVQEWLAEEIPTAILNPSTTTWQTTTENIPIMKNVGFECNVGVEDSFNGLAIVDFANKFVGGGILGSGMVQEEILFSSYPELLVSKLLTDELDDNEVLCVTGAHRFFKLKGYASKTSFFEYNFVHEDM